MAVPTEMEARRFYRCAQHRHSEAEVLLRAGHTTGAVYLAGYGVECMLKALILAATPVHGTNAVLKTFRGNAAHDYGSLKERYRRGAGSSISREVNEAFTLIQWWSTDLRYSPANVRNEEAATFMEAAEAVMKWADGRLG
jgi:HEPN domain-containing protein